MKDLPKISEALHRYLDEVETAYRTYSKELTYLEFMPYRVWITGGMNYGDSPTELYNTLMLLNSISVLEATGLNPTLPNHGKIVRKLVKRKDLQPLLIGVDSELDAILDKEMRHHDKKLR
jgi:hypothetical protein